MRLVPTIRARLFRDKSQAMEGQAAPVSINSRLVPVYSGPAFYQSRLSIPSVLRIPSATVLGFIGGFGLGLSHGGKMAGLRFRAENSHRFPTTQVGWYLYHKSKNYHIALGGIKEGMKMGGKVSLWAGSFFVVEEVIDQLRGTKDFVSTAVAGLGIAGAFSAWSKSIIHGL